MGYKTLEHYHVGNGTQSGETGSDPTDGSLIGKIYREERRDTNNTTVAEVYTDWSASDLGNNRDLVVATREVSDIDGQKTAQEWNYNISTGNLTSAINYGKVVASANTFSDTGNDKQTTNYTYTTSGPILPATEEILDQSSNRIRQSRMYYDAQSLGTATLGNLTKAESWVTGSSYINTQNTYTSK